MNLFLFLIFAIALIVFVIYEYLRFKRFKSELEINSIYRRMENHLVMNNVHLNTGYISMLKSYKSVILNPEMLDVQVLIMSQILLEKMGVPKEKIISDSRKEKEKIEKLGPEFQHLVQEFNAEASKLIKLSIYKPDFILFCMKFLTKVFIKKGITAFSKIKKDVSFVINNEMAIYKKSAEYLPC